MITKVFVAYCDRCLIQTTLDTTDKAVAMTKLLWVGWHLTEDQHLCPRCKDKSLKEEQE